MNPHILKIHPHLRITQSLYPILKPWNATSADPNELLKLPHVAYISPSVSWWNQLNPGESLTFLLFFAKSPFFSVNVHPFTHFPAPRPSCEADEFAAQRLRENVAPHVAAQPGRGEAKGQVGTLQKPGGFLGKREPSGDLTYGKEKPSIEVFVGVVCFWLMAPAGFMVQFHDGSEIYVDRVLLHEMVDVFFVSWLRLVDGL